MKVSTASSPGADCVSVYFLRSGSFIVTHKGRRLCFGEGSAAFSTDTPSAVGESAGQTRAAVIRVPLSRLQPRTFGADFGGISLAAVHSSPLFDFVETLIDTVAVNAIPAEPTATILTNLVDELLHGEEECQRTTTAQPGPDVAPRRNGATSDPRPMMALLALQSSAQNHWPLEHVACRAGFRTAKELKRALSLSFGVTAKQVRSNQARQENDLAADEQPTKSNQNAPQVSPVSTRKFAYTPHPTAVINTTR